MDYVCEITVAEYRDTYGLGISAIEFYLEQLIIANMGRYYTVAIEDPYHIDPYRIAFRLSVDWHADGVSCVGAHALEALLRHTVVGKLATPIVSLTVVADQDQEGT